MDQLTPERRPTTVPPPAASGRRGGRLLIGIVVLVVAVAGVGIAVGTLRPSASPSGVASTPWASPRPTRTPYVVPDPRTGTYADAYRALDAHAKALLAGDLAGWLAVVDPNSERMTTKYRRLFATLRGQKITTWSYHSVLEPKQYGPDQIIVPAYIVYCVQGDTCHPWNLDATGSEVPHTIRRSLLMTRRGQAWVILSDDTFGSPHSDPPWLATRSPARAGG